MLDDTIREVREQAEPVDLVDYYCRLHVGGCGEGHATRARAGGRWIEPRPECHCWTPMVRTVWDR